MYSNESRGVARENGGSAVLQHNEADPLLPKTAVTEALLDTSDCGTDPGTERQQKPSPVSGLFWIEAALFTNVFLAGFDGTVTASTYAVIASEFHGANLASWISTSYLVTTTALQPLYGRLSDLFGRRICLLAATTLFALGCLGCAGSPNMAALIAMRALAGSGGGGLMTMATIINTDLIPHEQRGMYQAVQNILHGLGSILGASLGGTISGIIGWRFCFLLQVPFCVAAFVIARLVVPASPSFPGSNHSAAPTEAHSDPNAVPVALSSEPTDSVLEEGCVNADESGRPRPATASEPANNKTFRAASTWAQIDFLGALLLISGLSLLLAALSVGSNSTTSWASPAMLGCLSGSALLLALFLTVEARTAAVPLLPLHMLHGRERGALLIMNMCLGMAGYGFLFLMPLFFQAVLLDSASVAGLRLVASSMATPLGGLTTGVLMRYLSRSSYSTPAVLSSLAQAGAILLVLGGVFNLMLGMHDASWKYAAYLTVGGFGQGMSYPAGLFRFIGACDFTDHAVATYLIYLVRSVGSVCGVAAISTVVQSRLVTRLTQTFSGKPGGDELIYILTHSIEALRDLPAETRQIVQEIYYEACRLGLYFLLAISGIILVCTVLSSPKQLSARS